MQVVQYLHSALLVSDLAKAEHFYGEVLGLVKIDRDLKFTGAWYQIGSVQIHLIVAAHVPGEIVDDRWGRNRHLAMAVSDLDALRARLQSCGYPVQNSASGRAALFTQDPDGNIIELSQASNPSCHPNGS